ncbi:hypothetical protein NERG_02755, partial [Nematocida ausubeli]
RLPKERLLSVLGKIRPEKINLHAFTPVAKQAVRALKDAPESLAALETYMSTVLAARHHSGLKGVLLHVTATLHPEKTQKPVRAPRRPREALQEENTSQAAATEESTL